MTTNDELIAFLKGYRVAYISEKTGLTRMTIYRLLDGDKMSDATLDAVKQFVSSQQVLAGQANIQQLA